MPELEISSVLDWLRREEPDRDGILAQSVTSVEAHPDVEAALSRLGGALEEALAVDRAVLASRLRTSLLRDDLRAVMGQLGFPRVLRLLDWLMQAGLPESDAILAAVLEPDPSGIGQYLQATLAGAAKPPLLERIYAPGRLAALMAACEPAVGLRVAA
ncbi:hypothetical protein [Acidisphaera sp. L21]|uniref:type IVB secretion system protein IcmW n=1 Tax=Acidisphaera sp. L21 TaxID=1641851 RepID=UPI00131B390E|nr:hypothetical protein [Acidisphaera sp. L21]